MKGLAPLMPCGFEIFPLKFLLIILGISNVLPHPNVLLFHKRHGSINSKRILIFRVSRVRAKSCKASKVFCTQVVVWTSLVDRDLHSHKKNRGRKKTSSVSPSRPQFTWGHSEIFQLIGFYILSIYWCFQAQESVMKIRFGRKSKNRGGQKTQLISLALAWLASPRHSWVRMKVDLPEAALFLSRGATFI